MPTKPGSPRSTVVAIALFSISPFFLLADLSCCLALALASERGLYYSARRRYSPHLRASRLRKRTHFYSAKRHGKAGEVRDSQDRWKTSDPRESKAESASSRSRFVGNDEWTACRQLLLLLPYALQSTSSAPRGIISLAVSNSCMAERPVRVPEVEARRHPLKSQQAVSTYQRWRLGRTSFFLPSSRPQL